jgi:hypothetical protein
MQSVNAQQLQVGSPWNARQGQLSVDARFPANSIQTDGHGR